MQIKSLKFLHLLLYIYFQLLVCDNDKGLRVSRIMVMVSVNICRIVTNRLMH